MASDDSALRLSGRFVIGEATLFDIQMLAVARGGWTCLLGPSGCGKTTLLRLFAGLETGGTFSGEITADRDEIAYMGQSDLLAPWLDAVGNVIFGDRLRGMTPDRARARALLASVGLEADTAKRPAELSGGMRQRVALARTLYEDRAIVLMDEPFSALDAVTRAAMQRLAFEVLAGRTVLLVTHDPAEAIRLGHRVLLMQHGGLHEVDLPETPPLRDIREARSIEAETGLMRALGVEA